MIEGSNLLEADSARPCLLRQQRVDDGGEPTRTAIQDDALIIADIDTNPICDALVIGNCGIPVDRGTLDIRSEI